MSGNGVEVRAVGATRAEVGEGPLWDGVRGEVWWVDLLAGLLQQSNPTTGATVALQFDRAVGGVGLRGAAGFVMADATGFCLLDRVGKVLVRQAFLPDGHRMNDAKVDPAGRYVAGSNDMEFAQGEGALWVLEPTGGVRQLLGGLTLPNGLGWSPDGSEFYLVDSEQHWLHAWSYDVAGGTLGPERELRTFAAAGEVPDGLCVDEEGSIWVALWGGGRVERYSVDGELLRVVELPVRQPSSCCFGGPTREDLYVTSAYRGLEERSSLDGALLCVPATGVHGVAVPVFAG